MVSEVNVFLTERGKRTKPLHFLIWDRAGWKSRKTGTGNKPATHQGETMSLWRDSMCQIHPRGQAWERKKRYGRQGRKTSSIFQDHLQLSWKGVSYERSVLLSPIQGKLPQAGNVVRKKSSSALEHNHDMILRGSYLHLVNR